MNKRDFIKTTAAASAIVAIPSIITSCTSEKKGDDDQVKNIVSSKFEQLELGYKYDALEPFIDARTMEIHYSKHHAGYVKKLNKAIENHPLKGNDIYNVLANLKDDNNDDFLRNNAGGHYNHTLFWDIMTPHKSSSPDSKLMEAINSEFDSFDNLIGAFKKAALSVFGSGWAWLILNRSGKLEITTTENQDNPLMKNITETNGNPILGIDVWEHAYYLKYQNRRSEYIDNFIKVINWEKVSEKLIL